MTQGNKERDNERTNTHNAITKEGTNGRNNETNKDIHN